MTQPSAMNKAGGACTLISPQFSSNHVRGSLSFVRLATVLVILAVCSCARADVRLQGLFTDHTVMQRDLADPVWGWANPGEKVSVAFADQQAAAVAGPDGSWMVHLKPIAAGGPYDLVVIGKNSLTLHDVLVGDVWLCGGQSNMELPVSATINAASEIAAADHPRLRLFQVAKTNLLNDPQKDISGGAWAVCSPATVAAFSGCGYYFGRDIGADMNVPVGLIEADYGGSQVEAWTDFATLQATPEAKPILDRWAPVIAAWPEVYAKYEADMAKWQAAVDAAKASALGAQKEPADPDAPAATLPPAAKPVGPAPKEPRRPFGPGHIYAPSNAYNSMIAPLMPFAIRGAIWYQGESNRDRAYQYRVMFPAMIRSWRAKWGEGDFPFLFVQLPGFAGNKDEPLPGPADSVWSEQREAQAIALGVANTAMAVAIDLGNGNIHPPDKQDVAHRLALAAEATAYGEPTDYRSPLYDSMTITGNSIRIAFKYATGGLVTRDNAAPLGFLIAGADHTFYRAKATIDGSTIVVSSDQVAQPAAVRFLWSDNPSTNLYGKNGLPVAPFRTDDWPGITAGKG